MKTDDLISVLAADTKPVAAGLLRGRLALACLIAAVAALALMLVWLHMRPDIHIAMRTAAFWIKAGYTLALAACGFALTLRMGRPGAGAREPARLTIAPAALRGPYGAGGGRAFAKLACRSAPGRLAGFDSWRGLPVPDPDRLGAGLSGRGRGAPGHGADAASSGRGGGGPLGQGCGQRAFMACTARRRA